jgi:Glycosyl hydrolase catalytic core
MMNKVACAFFLLLSFFILSGCGGSAGGSGGGTQGGALSVSLSNNAPLVFSSQASADVSVTLTRTGNTGNVTLAVTGLPSSAVVTVQSPGSTNAGTITLGAGTAPAGTYLAMVTASDGVALGTVPMTLTIGASTQVSSTVTGRLQLAMSTSFQPAEWDYQFFTNHPTAVTPLGNLQPQDIRLQPVSQGIPQSTPTTWDFTFSDAIIQPVLTVGDHSPEYQIATGPPFIYDSSHNFIDPTYGQFAAYAQDLVQYYNTGGFTDAGNTFHKSPSPYPITWWGIYNEPNYNNVSAAQYVQLYNATVPVMQAADPTLKFVAIELGGGNGIEQQYLPPFVNGVTAQVDVVATHYYSTCNQKDTDAKLFATIPGFAGQVQYIRSQLATKPTLANVPVWITENNVNADYQGANGMSTCNPGQQFVDDTRGSSAFFAAWRSLMFSQVGKAGAEALYHWDFAADAQYGELDDQTGNPRLGYWVDYWLSHMFPAKPGANLLQFSASDTTDLETLAVRNPDNSVVVMIANYAVASSVDNNGPGLSRVVSLDVSSLGTFANGSVLKIDSTTDVSNGPTPATIAPASPVQITLNGYGVAFVKLQ